MGAATGGWGGRWWESPRPRTCWAGAPRREAARADPERDASGAVDHYFIQESQPEVFRIDTESESEPRNRPLPQIRSRPARRPRVAQPQAQLRVEQHPHRGELRQRPLPHLSPVPGRPGTPGHAAFLRCPSSGERT